MLDTCVLPKKGRLSKAYRERQENPKFVAGQKSHPAVESAINGPEHRGLDLVRTHGKEGFARTVASVHTCHESVSYWIDPAEAGAEAMATCRMTCQSVVRFSSICRPLIGWQWLTMPTIWEFMLADVFPRVSGAPSGRIAATTAASSP